MGLDWNPIGKPKPGMEDEFTALFKRLGELPVNVGWTERLMRRLKGIDREKLDRRWREIQVTPYETVGAPRVGASKDADEWARKRYAETQTPKPSEADFLREMQGFYVLELAPPCDGLPVYSNWPMGYVEMFSFRAQILQRCIDIIGEQTLNKCYDSCLAPGLASLGHELRAWATSYAQTHGVAHMEHAAQAGDDDEAPESKAHMLFAAAKWCEYWSSRGHGLEAYW